MNSLRRRRRRNLLCIGKTNNTNSDVTTSTKVLCRAARIAETITAIWVRECARVCHCGDRDISLGKCLRAGRLIVDCTTSVLGWLSAVSCSAGLIVDVFDARHGSALLLTDTTLIKPDLLSSRATTRDRGQDATLHCRPVTGTNYSLSARRCCLGIKA